MTVSCASALHFPFLDLVVILSLAFVFVTPSPSFHVIFSALCVYLLPDILARMSCNIARWIGARGWSYEDSTLGAH
jgi:hypothetical protein